MSLTVRAVPGVAAFAVCCLLGCVIEETSPAPGPDGTGSKPRDGGLDAGRDAGREPEEEADPRWWAPGDGRAFPRALSYENELGSVTTLNLGGPTDTRGHPFFTPLGSNGRACVTCHQPADGMSLSVASIERRWRITNGKDPLFAAFDGSNCPSLPQAERASHSLLLERGLFRIPRPWPPRADDGSAIEPEFTIEVVRDPTGCNLDREYGLHGDTGTVSVYRRPRPATNLKYITAVGFSFDPKSGLPLKTDEETGLLNSGNLMSDDRNPTLKLQALDALHGHMERQGAPLPAQLAQILAFEQQLYTAQSTSLTAGLLSEAGAQGGPELLATAAAGVLQSSADPIWGEYLKWKELPADDGEPEERRLLRQSVGRGAELFVKRMFLVTDAAGVNDMGFGNPVRNGCAFCHNMQRVGIDVAPGQVDIGTANEPAASNKEDKPVLDLPLFKLTCRDDVRTHAHLGKVVYTHDPGYALTTGKCIDIGKITAQQMRGLAARAPYFSHGGAKTLRDLVDFYDERFAIELTDEEKDDLTHFLEVL